MVEVKVGLDDKSIEILDKLDKVHKQSIINFGIRLAKDTDFYKILVGEEDIVIKNNEDEDLIEDETKPTKKPKKQEKEEKNDILDLGDFM